MTVKELIEKLKECDPNEIIHFSYTRQDASSNRVVVEALRLDKLEVKYSPSLLALSK